MSSATIVKRVRRIKSSCAAHPLPGLVEGPLGQWWISMDPAPRIRKMCGVRNITSYYVYDPWGLVAKMTGGSTYFYHFDGLGSTGAITNPSGNIVNKYAYDEYGNVLNQVEAVSNPFKYVGRYGVMADDTGLLYMRARYYDPDTGRFLSKDPIRFRGGDVNLYRYALNNPVNWVDPLGLFNPTKAGAAIANAFNAGHLYASGMTKIATAAGLTSTGVGAPAGAGLAALGFWNLYSATAAQERALQEWNEALQEPWSAASWRNLLGVLPYGQHFDDPCEPSFSEFYRQKYERLTEKAENLWDFIREIGTIGF